MMSVSELDWDLPPFGMEDTGFQDADSRAEWERRHRREPLRVWRAALQAGVTAMSPALVDMAAVRGVDVARAVCGLRPPPAWRAGAPLPTPGGWEDVWPKAPGPGRRASPWGRSGRTPQAIRAGAVPKCDPAGPFVMALDGSSLSGCAEVAGADLLTHGGLLQIWLRQFVPDTVLSGVAGVRADRLVEHPVLAGRDYPVVRAFRAQRWTVVEVETGLIPYAMPWPDLAAGDSAGAAIGART